MTPKQIVKLRRALGFTQQQLADAIGGARRHSVARWEIGDRKPSGLYVRALEELAASIKRRENKPQSASGIKLTRMIVPVPVTIIEHEATDFADAEAKGDFVIKVEDAFFGMEIKVPPIFENNKEVFKKEVIEAFKRRYPTRRKRGGLSKTNKTKPKR